LKDEFIKLKINNDELKVESLIFKQSWMRKYTQEGAQNSLEVNEGIAFESFLHKIEDEEKNIVA